MSPKIGLEHMTGNLSDTRLDKQQMHVKSLNLDNNLSILNKSKCFVLIERIIRVETRKIRERGLLCIDFKWTIQIHSFAMDVLKISPNIDISACSVLTLISVVSA